MGVDNSEQKKLLKHNILKSGAWYSIGNICNIILGLVKIYIMAKVFVPKEYGIYSITLMMMTLVQSFTTIGARDYLIREAYPNEKTITTAFSLDLIRGVFAFLLMFFLAVPISKIYEEPLLAKYLSTVSLAFLFIAFRNINVYKLYSEFRGKYTFLVMQFPIIVTNILIIVVAVIYKNIFLVVVLNVITELLITLLSYLTYFRRPTIRIYKKEFKSLFSFSAQLYLMTILAYALRQLDYYFVSFYFGLEVLALYTLAFRIMNIVTESILPVVMNIFYPLISKSTEIKRKEYIKYLINGILAFFFLFGINVYLYMDELIFYVFKDKWSGLYDLLLFFVVYSMVRALLSVLGLNLKVNNKLKYENYSSTIEIIVIGVLIYPFSLKFGIYGVAISITVALLIRFIVINSISSKLFNINLMKMVMKKDIILFAILSTSINLTVVKFFDMNNVVNTILPIIINLGVVCITTSLFIWHRFKSSKLQ